MATGILEFDLTCEQHEFAVATAAGDMEQLLNLLDQELRAKVKYENLATEERQAYQHARDRLWGLAEELNVARLLQC